MAEDPREADQIEGVPLPEERTAVIGHDEALAGLLARIAERRLPSAILIHGPQGVGKATFAFALAREILATTGDEAPERVAEQVAAGSHPNLFVLRRPPKDGKGFYTVIRVEDVRELRERMRKTRGRAGWRVAIVDAIDDCNPSAANALLKTLEEPPAETIFLLVSHRPGSLLPTIRSRCHVLALRPLADADVRAVISAEPAVTGSVEHAVALAAGRPRRAYEAMGLGDDTALVSLQNWLAAPARTPIAAEMALADVLATGWNGAQGGFIRDILNDWLAAEARGAALAGPPARMRLASASELWEKAHALFAEAEALNLDARQTLTGVLDAIRRHVLKTWPSEAP